MNNKKQQTIAVLLLLLVAIIWGSGFIASQIALDSNVSPELIMLARFSIATIIVGTAFFKPVVKNGFKNFFSLLPSGIFLFLAFFMQIVALQFTTPANNAFLTATNVVMVPFIWWAISKKKPAVNIFVASILCLIGIAVLSVKFDQGMRFRLGDSLTVLCALFFAGHIVSTGIVAKKVDTHIVVFFQFLISAVMSAIVFFLFSDRDISALSTLPANLSLLYLGVFSTCVCYFLQTYGQKFVNASKAAIILGTEALFGSLFAVIIGYDELTWNMMLGGAIVMVALIMTESAGSKKSD